MTKRRLLGAAILVFAAGVTARAQNTEHKFEAGAQFSIINRAPIFRGSPFRETLPNLSGFGGRFGYSPSRFWSLEAEMNFFPRGDSSRFNGFKTQGLFGVKAGARFEKFGVFGKVRPGFIRFEHVTDCPEGTIRSCNDNGKTKLALDMGGVAEYYPTDRTAVRVDFGDTVIKYGSITLLPFFPEIPTPIRLRAGTTHNFQFSAGFTVRF